MAGPENKRAAAAAGRGHLRASHADREQVIGMLKVAFVQGRLTKDELDARAGQTFAARTYGELAAITADLPAGLVEARTPSKPDRAPTGPPVGKVMVVGAAVLLPPATIAAAFLANSERLFMAAMMMMVFYFMALLVAGGQLLDSWHQKRFRKQLPPRPAQRGRALGGSRTAESAKI